MRPPTDPLDERVVWWKLVILVAGGALIAWWLIVAFLTYVRGVRGY